MAPIAVTTSLRRDKSKSQTVESIFERRAELTSLLCCPSCFPAVCLRLSQNGRRSPGRADGTRKRCGGGTPPPMCSDHDWVSRCPSGCRIQGLILEHESKVENKLRNVCKTAKTYEDAAERSMSATARVYHRGREHIVNTAALQATFGEGAEDLTKNLTSLRKRSERLDLRMAELEERVQEQLQELLRAEVEVDVRLRSCLGSCRSGSSFAVSLEDHAALRSQTEQMHRRQRKSDTAKPKRIPQIRATPVDFGPEPSPVYKTIRTVLDEGLNLFEDLRPKRLELDDTYDSSELE
ncbi:fibrinogen alpha chain [Eucyclogobius newberryi]|uniref:fibrinogen alpha chain n=1 Tax=Eucyclogobius newberryi TaxID=166745 RepID=UPI003B5C8D83